jgi:hypothetical protein
MNKLKRKYTFDEIIKKNKSFNINLPNRIFTNINNNILNYLTYTDDDYIKNKILMLDKETQKDYELQNYDIFPNMYNIIDAEATHIFKNDKQIQTKRFILKDFPTPYSSYPPSDKPPSTPPDHNIYKRTPTPSNKSSDKSEEKEKGNKSLIRRYLDLFETSPQPTPPRTPTPPSPIYIYSKPPRSPPPSPPQSSSSSSSVPLSWTSRQVRERSRSRSF